MLIPEGGHVSKLTAVVHEWDSERRSRNLFDDDDSLLCGLVRDDVEHVVATHDTVLHLSVATDVWIVCLDSPDGAPNLYGLHSSHPERIYKWGEGEKKIVGTLSQTCSYV